VIGTASGDASATGAAAQGTSPLRGGRAVGPRFFRAPRWRAEHLPWAQVLVPWARVLLSLTEFRTRAGSLRPPSRPAGDQTKSARTDNSRRGQRGWAARAVGVAAFSCGRPAPRAPPKGRAAPSARVHQRGARRARNPVLPGDRAPLAPLPSAGILTSFPFPVRVLFPGTDVEPPRLRVRTDSLASQHASRENLLFLSRGNSHPTLCYSHQDLHQRPFHPPSQAGFATRRPCGLATSAPPYISLPRRGAKGEDRQPASTAIHFRSHYIRPVSCYTLLGGFQLPWPPSGCLHVVTSFLAFERAFGRLFSPAG